jgi:hypothetical protein
MAFPDSLVSANTSNETGKISVRSTRQFPRLDIQPRFEVPLTCLIFHRPRGKEDPTTPSLNLAFDGTEDLVMSPRGSEESCWPRSVANFGLLGPPPDSARLPSMLSRSPAQRRHDGCAYS